MVTGRGRAKGEGGRGKGEGGRRKGKGEGIRKALVYEG